MILNGQLVRGASGLAGEFGHVTIDEDGPVCACGNRGCWEVFASNSAAIRYYNEAGRGKHPVKTFAEILALAGQGNPRALNALERMAEYIGKGVAMLVMGFAPEIIVIVGEITHVWGKVSPIVTNMVQRRASTHPAVKIIASNPASQPRLRGIVALVLQKHFWAPTIA